MIVALVAGVRAAATFLMHRGITLPTAALAEAVVKHKGIRRALVLWAACIITWVTKQVFTNPSTISHDEMLAYGISVGILTTVLGLYQYGRSQEENRRTNVPPQ